MIAFVRRPGRRALIAAVSAGVLVTGIVTAGSASASPTPDPYFVSGTSSVAFGGAAWGEIGALGCGTPTVSSHSSQVSIITTGHEIRANFPVSAVLYDGQYSNIVEIDNSGSVTFSNLCYDITLSTPRFRGSSALATSTVWDVTAVTHSGDDVGRQLVFELDFNDMVTSTTYTGPNYKQRIEKLNLTLASEGAEELNELCACSLFSSGQQVGNGKVSFVLSP